MNVCIFCSANDLDEKYTQPAKELAEALAKAGHTLVWGGSNRGLMKVVADGVQNGGGKVVGVSMDIFKGTARPNADEMIIAKNLGERKASLLELADVVVMLVGGLGTLDEATEVIELKKETRHDKDIIVLNTDGFYDGFKSQLERMASEGFLPATEQEHIKIRALEEFVRFVNTPAEAMELIGKSKHPRPVMEVFEESPEPVDEPEKEENEATKTKPADTGQRLISDADIAEAAELLEKFSKKS